MNIVGGRSYRNCNFYINSGIWPSKDRKQVVKESFGEKFQEICERRKGKLIIVGNLNARVGNGAEWWGGE